MYGTPVLGANIGGIPELIQVGKTGELFESGNAEDLKKKIEKLWGDKELCAKYSANCKDISFVPYFIACAISVNYANNDDGSELE